MNEQSSKELYLEENQSTNDDLNDELENDFTDEEEIPLTTQKILTLVGIGIGFFVLFVILLFPLEEVIKSSIIDFTKSRNISFEFKDIKFPILGQKRIDSFVFSPTNETILKSEETLIDLKMLDLIQNKVDGEVSFSSFSIDSGQTSILFKNLNLAGRLSGFEERISKTTGDMNIMIRSGKIISLPDIPLVGEAKDIQIIKGSFILKFRSGKILIERGSFDTSWFKFNFSGTIRLSDIVSMSALDLKICATSQEKFANERPDLAGMLAILPQENGKSCIPIKGTIKNPEFNLDALTQGSNLNSNPSLEQNSSNPNTDPIIKDSESTKSP
ncbi:MAG: type II secretion system protein GspN [Leptospiraceae bacterium]|jgi:type II secretion system protein N|nr:type II secretion system protein GspN [Leptospiraceae bacterium]PJE02422.1 MAG: type II secretion system protein GspN [Leptospira sp.]